MKTLFVVGLVAAMAVPAFSRASDDVVMFPAKSISFTGAELATLLPKYSELVKRNLLRSPAAEGQLRKPVSFINETPLTRSAAIQAFEAVFATNGISLAPMGDKFIKVMRTGAAVVPHRAGVWASATATNAITFPPRAINFNGAPLDFVLKYYSELLGCNVSREPRVQSALHAPAFFTNQTPLTRRETLEGFEEMLLLHGIGITETSSGLSAVPVSDLKTVTSGVPKPSTPPKK